MPIGIRVTDLPAAAGTLDDDDEFLTLEDGSLRRATRTQAGPKAAIVQVADTANQFTGTNVETVLAEIQDNVDALVISGGGISVASEAEVAVGTNNTKAVTPATSDRKFRVHHNFRDDTATGTPPTDAESGQPWVHRGTNSTHYLRVVDDANSIGGLTNQVASGGSAGYAEIELGGNVTRIGGKVTFTPWTTQGGGATFAIWQTTHNHPTIPYAPLHLVVSPEFVLVDIWETPTGNDQIGIAHFAPDLTADGETEHTIEATISGDTVTVVISNGTVLVVSDPRIAAYAGPWACWEVFQTASATDSKPWFREVWAVAGSKSYDAPDPVTLGALATGMATTVSTAMAPRSARRSATASDIVVPNAAFGDVHADLAVTFSAPASTAVDVRWSGFLAMTGSTRVLWGVKDAANVQHAAVSVINQQFNGLLTLEQRVVGLVPGQSYTFRWTHLALAATTATLKVDAPNGYVPTFVVTPVV